MPDPSGVPAQSTLEEARRLFLDRYHREPEWLIAAPGRVNLIGEHVDYNGGLVLPMAIERHLVLAGGLNGTDTFNAVTPLFDESLSFSTAHQVTKGDPPWSNYLRGVVALFQERGITVPGINLALASDLPLGGGLSSSAALEVGVATLLEAVTGTQLKGPEKAKLCQRAEHEYAGVPCGIMDQFAVTLGRRDHLLRLDCQTEEFAHIPFSHPRISVLIINSKVKHALSDGEYERRRADCEEACDILKVDSLRSLSPVTRDLQETLSLLESDRLRRRVRHVIGEIRRTSFFSLQIQGEGFRRAGSLMFASHISLRDDYEVSCAELDLLVELAADHRDRGLYGSRMTGGGFGGCTVSLVEADRADELAKSICEIYHERTGIEPESFITRAADGARVLT